MKTISKAITATAILIFTACSDSVERDSSNIAYETQTAIKTARKQAQRLSESEKLNTIEIEKIIIDVRVREQQLRQEGESQLADTYISTFLSTLDSVNPALRSEILSTN